MRDCPVDLAADLDSDCTTLCRLWRVTRTDGTVLRFTDAVRPVVVAGQTYRSDISFTTSAIQTTTAASSQNVTMTVVMGSDGISETGLRAGIFTDALGEVFYCNYAAPAHGVMEIFAGTFGQVVISDKLRATIDLIPVSVSATGGSLAVESYCATCRNSWGDPICNKDGTTNPNDFKVDFTVTAVPSVFTFIDTANLTQADQHWTQGTVLWTGGNNIGQASSIASSNQTAKSVSLSSTLLKPILVGDTGSVFPGCARDRPTCKTKYNNLVNYRGEPDVPVNLQGLALQQLPPNLDSTNTFQII